MVYNFIHQRNSDQETQRFYLAIIRMNIITKKMLTRSRGTELSARKTLKRLKIGAREKAQWLGELAAHPEVPGSIHT